MFGAILGAVASTVIGGLMAEEGAEDANQANSAEAQRNREFNAEEAQKNRVFQDEQAAINRHFQQYNSNSAYQRATADMKAAGLNPMLAYSQGGAGTPVGAQGAGSQATGSLAHPMQNTKAAGVDAANKAMQTAQSLANVKVLDETAKKTAAETDNIRARTEVEKANEPYVRQQTTTSAAQAEELKTRAGLNDAQINKVTYEVNKIIADTVLTNTKEQLTAKEIDLVKQQILTAIETQENIRANTGNTKVDTVLKNLEIPLARNIANFQNSAYGRELSQAVREASNVGSSAASIKDKLNPAPREYRRR